jgi:uncharacterized protein YgbK (DUF1537 family)
MRPWHVLADDLTGALDCAAAWAGAAEVSVFLDRPGQYATGVQLVATGTRDVPASKLPALLTPSLGWLVDGGSAYKKVDSLLRGNTFAEIAWLMGSGLFAGAVFAPAFPAQGRFTARGHHWVAPAHQPHGARSHQHACSLPEAFAAVGLNAQMWDRIPNQLQDTGQLVIPDVLNDQDLDRLATLSTTAQAQRWLWCGSAGLAWALARKTAHAANVTLPNPIQGASLVLTASRHPVLREQLSQLQLPDAGTELFDFSEAQELSPIEAQARLMQRMHGFVRTTERPAALVVVGGDTLLCLCRAAEVRSLLAGPSPRAGWGCARLVGGQWDGLTCYSRSGAFGAPDDLRALLLTLSPSHPSH